MEIDKMDYLFILAGRMEQAVCFANLVGIPRTRMRYINHSDRLRGIDGVGRALWLVGDPETRPDYYRLIGEAKVSGFTIVHESRLHPHLEMAGKNQVDNCQTTLVAVTYDQE